jgi:U3 small nucleolar RNA-associated protein 11
VSTRHACRRSRLVIDRISISSLRSDFTQKQNALKLMRKKALDKNPDEFYFHMVNAQLNDGVHYEKLKGDEFTEDQVKLMQSQDVNYILYKRGVELKKIEKLKAGLHLLDVEGKPRNKHIFFTDTKEEARNFDLAKRLDTVPELLGRTYNVPTLSKLKDKKLFTQSDADSLEKLARKR